MFLNRGGKVLTFALGLVPTVRGDSEGGRQEIIKL